MFILFISFFFNDTATTEIYTLSLHDALPIWANLFAFSQISQKSCSPFALSSRLTSPRLKRVNSFSDRKSTRLNSSHPSISYAVFCLKKKNFYQHDTSLTFVCFCCYYSCHCFC